MPPFDDRHSTHIQTDDSPTSGSTNLVTSGALHTALAAKEETLTFANNALETVTGGSIARAEGTNVITYTPPTLNKAAVGLGNVDDTSDAAKPVSTAQQTALNLKANLSGATFTGDITTSVIKSTHSKIEFSYVTPGHGGSNTPVCIIIGDFDGYPDLGIEFDADIIQSRNGTATNKLYLNFFGSEVYVNGSTSDHLVRCVGGDYSDDRMKFNEVSFGEALPLILQLQVKQYEKTSHIMTTAEELAFEQGEDGFASRVPQGPNEYFGHSTEIGVIAQEIQSILPTAVTIGNDTEPWKVKYDHLTCVAIKAIQELNATIASLEARIVALGG